MANSNFITNVTLDDDNNYHDDGIIDQPGHRGEVEIFLPGVLWSIYVNYIALVSFMYVPCGLGAWYRIVFPYCTTVLFLRDLAMRGGNAPPS